MNAKKINKHTDVSEKRKVVKNFYLRGLEPKEIVNKTSMDLQDVKRVIGWLEANDIDIVQHNAALQFSSMEKKDVELDWYDELNDSIKAKFNSREDIEANYFIYVDQNKLVSNEKYNDVLLSTKLDIINEYLKGKVSIKYLHETYGVSAHCVRAILNVYIRPNVLNEIRMINTASRTKSILDDDIKVKIAEDYETMKYSKVALSEKYGIHRVTIDKILKEFFDEEKLKSINKEIRKKNIKNARKSLHKEEANDAVEEEKINDVVDEESCNEVAVVEDTNPVSDATNIINAMPNLKLMPLEMSKVTVGLCDGRHNNIPVNEFIFSDIPNYRLSDYDWMKETVINFIKSNIKFDRNGNAENVLEVYMTGLAAAHFALASACEELRVNLNALHYNRLTNKYDKQIVFDRFNTTNSIVAKLNSIIKQDVIMLLDSKVDDYDDNKNFFELNIMIKSNRKIMSKYSILSLDYAVLLAYQAKLQFEYFNERRSEVITYTLVVNQYNMNNKVAKQISSMQF